MKHKADSIARLLAVQLLWRCKLSIKYAVGANNFSGFGISSYDSALLCAGRRTILCVCIEWKKTLASMTHTYIAHPHTHIVAHTTASAQEGCFEC